MNQSKELPKEIQDRIWSEAKDNHCTPYGDPNPATYAYQQAATAWAQIAIGFKNWCDENASQIDFAEQRTHTDEELLIEYLKTLPQ